MKDYTQKFALHEGFPRGGIITRILTFLTDLPDDRDWEITVRRKKRPRTGDQNNLFHKMCGQLAQEMGQPGEEGKEQVKAAVKDALGLKEWIDTPSGKRIEVNKPTHLYSVEEMTALMTAMIAWADEFGYTIHMPDDDGT